MKSFGGRGRNNCAMAVGTLAKGVGLALLVGAALAGCAEKPAPPALTGQQVVLDGARNFRDLGGYATGDGKHVKAGLLYRADSLAELTEADLARLAKLQLHSVYDFRTPAEVGPAPDRLPAGQAIRQVELPIGDPAMNVEELRQRILAGDLDALPVLDSYADVVLKHSATYRAWFENLLDPANIPGVFHCTGGKDRTGVGAALFLYALGVPRETALQDYMASNYYLHDYIESTLWKVRFASGFKVDGDRFRALMGVRESYLEKAFATIEVQYGSLDNYLEQALGLDAAKRAQLRALYLE